MYQIIEEEMGKKDAKNKLNKLYVEISETKIEFCKIII
jgi:hypothetical protein